jgi:hypothetical protein
MVRYGLRALLSEKLSETSRCCPSMRNRGKTSFPGRELVIVGRKCVKESLSTRTHSLLTKCCEPHQSCAPFGGQGTDYCALQPKIGPMIAKYNAATAPCEWLFGFFWDAHSPRLDRRFGPCFTGHIAFLLIQFCRLAIVFKLYRRNSSPNISTRRTFEQPGFAKWGEK